jgi:hypothetical protein
MQLSLSIIVVLCACAPFMVIAGGGGTTAGKPKYCEEANERMTDIPRMVGMSGKRAFM